MKIIVEDGLKQEITNLNCKWLLDDCKSIIKEVGLKELDIRFTQKKGEFGESSSKLVIRDLEGRIIVIKDYNFGDKTDSEITFKYCDGILSK